MAAAGYVVAPEHVGGDALVRVEEVVKNLQTENVSLHGGLVAEKTIHARTLMVNIRPQRDKKKAVAGR